MSVLVNTNMIKNKLYGLRLMKRAFKGVEGISVLPWRVYDSPKEFADSHFPGAKRLLIRTNMPGNNGYETWSYLPREDAHGNAIEKMTEMHDYWLNTAKAEVIANELREEKVKPEAIQFIVHKVEPRNEYQLNLQVHFRLGKVRLVSANLAQGKVWRNSPKDFIDAMNFEDLAKYITAHEPSLQVHANQIVANLEQGYRKVIEKLRDEGHEVDKVDFEMSAATHKDRPTHVEFYDFLLKRTKKEPIKQTK